MGSQTPALMWCILVIGCVAIGHETTRAAPVSLPMTPALEEFFNDLDADRNGQVDAKEASAFIANLGGAEYDEPKEVAQGVEAFLQVGVPKLPLQASIHTRGQLRPPSCPVCPPCTILALQQGSTI